MALRLGAAILDVLADTSKFERSLRPGTKKALDQMVRDYEDASARAGESGGEQISNATGRAALAAAARPFGNFAVGAAKLTARAMSTSLAIAGTAAAAGIGYTLYRGFARLTAIDSAEGKMRGLGYTTRDIEGIMSDALKVVRGTAFGLDEAATLAANAVAAGIPPGKELQNYLSLIANTATVAGVDMAEMGMVFQDIAASGRVTGRDMWQFMSRGIPVLQILSQELGKKPEEISKMVTAGKIDFQTFATAMQNYMGDAAQASGSTFEGSMRNLQASISRIGANLLRPIFGQLTPLVQEITKAFGNIEEGAVGIGEVFGPIFTQAVGMVRDFIREMTAGGGSFDWMGLAADVARSLLTVFEAFLSVMRVWIPYLAAVAVVGAKVFVWLVNMLRPLLENERLIKAVVVAWLALSGIGTIISIYRTITGVIQAVTLAMNAQALMANATRAQEIAYTVALGAKTFATNVATVAQWLFNAAMAAGLLPIIAVVAAIGLLVAAFVIAYKRSETFRRFVHAALNAVKDAALAVVDWFRNSFVPFFRDTIPEAGQAALAWVRTRWSQITRWFTRPVDAARSGVSTAMATVSNAIQTAISWVINWVRSNWPILIGILTGPLGYAVALIIQNWDQVKAAMLAAWNAIRPVFVAIGNGFTAVGRTIARIFNTWIRPFIQLFQAIVIWLFRAGVRVAVTQIQNAWRGLGIIWRATYNGVIRPVINGFANLIRWLSNNVVRPITRAIQTSWAAVGTGFRRIWTGFIKPVLDAFARTGRALRDTLANIWAQVVTRFTWLRDRFRVIAVWIRDNVFGWLRARAADLRTNLYNIWESVRSRFSWLRDRFRAIVIWIRDNVFLWVKNRAVDLRISLYGIWTSVRDRFAWMRDRFREIVLWIRDNVFLVFGNKAAEMRDRFSKIATSIRDWWAKLKGWARAPIAFVVNTVIQKGLVSNFNKLAGKFPGVDKLPNVSMATGGVMPGYTPGRDVHRFWSPTAGRLDLSGGEGIMVPQWVRAMGGPKAVAAMNRAARFGQRLAGGGTFQPVGPPPGNRHTSGYGWATWAGDFPRGMGTPVRAWKPGKVVLVRHLTTSYGQHVRMNHEDGTSSLYAHMSRILVRIGQQLAGGARLGLVGSTGNSTGPHLHFETTGGPYRGGQAGGAGSSNDMLTGVISSLKDKVTGSIGQIARKFGQNSIVQMATGAGRKLITGAVSKLTDAASKVFDKATGTIKSAASWVGAKIGVFSREQLNNAAIIIDVARKLGFGDRGAQIALMTALQESTLRNINYGDRDSIGLFQQRRPWGTNAERMNPATSTSMFFNGGRGGQRGLRAFDWRNLAMGVAAQKVQVSAYPDAYNKWADEAATLIRKAGKFDNGGFLRPGQFALNTTNRREPTAVFTPNQWATLERVASTGGGVGTINVQLSMSDLSQLRDLDHFLQIIDRARVRGRTTARSGITTVG